MKSPSVLPIVVPLLARHRPRILRHFLALSREDRMLRFGHAPSDEALVQFVAELDFAQDRLFGLAKPRGALLALAHLAVRANAPGRVELGLSVLARARGKGLGSRLFQLALQVCRAAEVQTLYMHCLATNQTMLHIAQKAGMLIVREHGEADAWLQFPPPLPGGISGKISSMQCDSRRLLS